MRGVDVAAGAAAIALIGSLGTATPAHASDFGIELNGQYRVMSDGEWAKTNEVYIDQQTVVQTWTMSSSCSSPIACTGEVVSDQGWTASLKFKGDYWLAERAIANWVPCADGTFAPGNQSYRFWGWNPGTSERSAKIRDLLVGEGTTKGPSGACGVNKPVVIEIPLRLEQL